MTDTTSDLVWPPFKALYDRLEGIKLDPGAVDVASLQQILKDYTPWLAKGLDCFKPPSDASKRVIETEQSIKYYAFGGLSSGDIPIEAALRDPSLAISKALVRNLSTHIAIIAKINTKSNTNKYVRRI